MGRRSALKPADWALWAQMPHTQLWKAVALSCDIEPLSIPAEVVRAEAEVFGGVAALPAEYKRRRQIADAHAQPGGLLPMRKRLQDMPASEVVLADLRAFGERFEPPWGFPDQFPRANPPLTRVPPQSSGSSMEGNAHGAGARDQEVVKVHAPLRRSLLSPVIELAQGKAQNRFDVADVWAQLQQLAAERTAPLIGATEDGIQYRKDGDVSILTRDALRLKLQRLEATHADGDAKRR